MDLIQSEKLFIDSAKAGLKVAGFFC